MGAFIASINQSAYYVDGPAVFEKGPAQFSTRRMPRNASTIPAGPISFRIVIPPYSSVPISKDEETNTKSVVALTEIQILARNSLRLAPGAAH
jgi:hypothetical protein